MLRDTWDLPRPGIEPLSPAVAGGFLTTEPSDKPKSKPLEAWSQHPQCLPFSYVLLGRVIKQTVLKEGRNRFSLWEAGAAVTLLRVYAKGKPLTGVTDTAVTQPGHTSRKLTDWVCTRIINFIL